MLLPPKHSWVPGLAIISVGFGILVILAAACIIFEKKTRQVSLLLACVLLLIFFSCFTPYQFITGSNYRHLGTWENAEKEMALACGALVIAGCFSDKNEGRFFSFMGKLVPLGAIFYSVTLISFGVLHFLYAQEASTLVPAWIPNHLFWVYFAGVALIGSGIAIIVKIKIGLIATLLGAMIFTWFIVLHIPRIVVALPAEMGGEVVSAFLALAYSGIALVISREVKTREPLNI